MMVTTSTMLILLMIKRHIPEQNVSLIVVDSVLLGVAVGMIFKLVSTLFTLNYSYNKLPPNKPDKKDY